MLSVRSLVRVKPLEILELKDRLLNEFSVLLSDSEKVRALSDPHSKRAPRWCGITVHFTVNCPFSCAYCYIEDMGFSFSNPSPYPLSGREIAFALLSNPAFLPGVTGTLIAVGAVSEPFIFFSDALGKLRWLARLGNPIQFSTKQYISSTMAENIYRISYETSTPISPLVTIVTLEHYRELEKNAPSPERRLDGIKNMRDAGLKPILFLRPIMPGINSNEIDNILRSARDAGASGVVVGGFRITRKIAERLENLGFDLSEITRRLKKIDDKQRSVPLPEKKTIIEKAKQYGLIPWASACCANSWNAKVPCPSACFISGPCTMCPNMCSYPQHVPQEKEIIEALSRLNIRAEIKGDKMKILNQPFKGISMLVRNLSRRSVILSRRSKREQ